VQVERQRPIAVELQLGRVFDLSFMLHRFGLIALCLLALGTTQRLCPIHNVPMTRAQVPVIFIVDRHRIEEWQAYTNARSHLFPYSRDDIQTNFDDLPLNKSGEVDWRKVSTNAWIYVCPVCDERKHKWQAEHPPRKAEPGENP